MIHYQLQCSAGHAFDGWFRDSAAFDSQAADGLVECPVCGVSSVSRALMAPALSRSHELAVTPPPAPAPMAVGGERMPDHVRAVLQRLRAKVERECDYLGDQFADEARRIYHGEVEPRGIYGETTPDQAEALADEGIEIGRIPWLPRADG